jgi:REP element-mobilizing transposase RayT
LERRVDAWLVDLLRRKAHAVGCALLAAGVAADHVHVLVRYPSRVSIATIAHRLKGASSRALHLAFPHKQPAMWQVGYWAESVSLEHVEGLVPYLRGQREHHHEAQGEHWGSSLR